MTEAEHEKKLLISEREYKLLQSIFSHSKSYDQTNFYYDTKNNTFNAARTTIRIRLKNGEFTGTKKAHIVGEESTEESFRISELPYGFGADGKYVTLKGSLITKRTEIPISRYMTLFLDKNEYLGMTDYELELEYRDGAGSDAEARGVFLLLLALLGRCFAQTPSSKSERFFERLMAQSAEKENVWKV